MYSVSSGFLTNIQNGGRIISAYVVIDGVTYSGEQIVSLNFNHGVNGERFEVGLTPSAYCEIRLKNIPTTTVVDNKTVTAFIGCEVSGIQEYVPLGNFVVDESSRTKTELTIHCMDKMVQLETEYISSLTYPAQISDVLNEVLTGFAKSITLPSYLTNYQVMQFDKKTKRQVLGHIAALAASTAYVDRAGTFKFKTVNNSPSTSPVQTITGDTYFHLNREDNIYSIYKVSLTDGIDIWSAQNTSTGTTTFELGVYNPYATSGIVTNIKNAVANTPLLTFDLEYIGNPALELGDNIRVDEYIDEFTTRTFYVNVSQISLKYDGSLSGTVASVGEGKNKNLFGTQGELASAVVQVNDLANTAKDAAATAQTTANTALTSANGKNKVFYNANASVPTATSIGDMWFVSDNDNLLRTWSGSAWVDKSIGKLAISSVDAGAITTGALDANRIGANTITANKMVAGTITAASGIIADAAITNAKISDLSADKINAGTLSANRIGAGSISAEKLTIGLRSGNLIPNNFSLTGTTDTWTISGGTITTDTFNGGTVSVFQMSTSSNWQTTSDYIEVDASLSYEFSMWIREVTARTVGNTYMGIYAYDANKTLLTVTPVSLTGTKGTATNNYYWLNSSAWGTSWKRVVGYAFAFDTNGGWDNGENQTAYATTNYGNCVLPSNTRYVRLRFLNYNNAGTTSTVNFYNPQIAPVSQTLISGDTIKTGTLDASKIITGSITANEITAGTITATQIADASITGAKIAGTTITASNIANTTITGGKIALATITGSNLVNGTITGTQIAASTITGSNISTGTITATQIADSTITATEIANSTITGGKIASATITGANIAAGTITGSNILDATITSTEIANSTITGGKIAATTITDSNIVSATITGAKIANATITDANIGSLSASKITAGVITTNGFTSSGLSETGSYSKVEKDRISFFNSTGTAKIGLGILTATSLPDLTSPKLVLGGGQGDVLSSTFVSSGGSRGTFGFVGTNGVPYYLEINNSGNALFSLNKIINDNFEPVSNGGGTLGTSTKYYSIGYMNDLVVTPGNLIVGHTTNSVTVASLWLYNDTSCGRINHTKTVTGNKYVSAYYYSGTMKGNITMTDTSTVFNTTSDYRLKEDNKDFNAIELISKIKMYDFKWKDSDERTHGVYAHELQEFVPYAVTGKKDGEELQSVDYSKLVPILTKAIQELNAKVEQLEKAV